MADLKISELTNLTAADPANDMIPIVDVSATPPASGSTKRISINNILACSPTATLASATISGDLTVDTSTLKVDSANDRVGIGLAAGINAKLHVSSTGSVHINQRTGNNGCFTQYMDPTSSNYVGTDSGNFRVANNSGQDLLNIQQLGVFTFGDGAGGTRMTLNSTGLGVGASPTGKLTIGTGAYVAGTLSGTSSLYSTVGQGLVVLADGLVVGTRTGSDRFILDTSGNVGIGVVPKPWRSGARALQLGANGYLTLNEQANGNANICFAAYEGSANVFNYTTTGDLPSRYVLVSGTHQWYTAPSGTANDPISFGNAKMTLDASGNLLVGLTNTTGANYASKFFLSADSGTTKWCVGPYAIATNFIIAAAASGGVYLNGTAATSWTSASDERLKDIIEPISNAVSKVASLRAVIGKFKSDENNTRKPFIIAQDVQAVLPEAVDASNPDKLGVAYSDVIPLLVAAIKELTAEVNALKNV